MTPAQPSLSIIAVTPAYHLAPSIAIAAVRAGHAGVLDVSFADPEARTTLAAIERLAVLGRGSFGLKLAGDDPRLITALPEALLPQLSLVILTATDLESLTAHIALLRDKGRGDLRILLEATSQAEAELGQTAGVDGIIAKGNEAGGRVGEETAFILLQRLSGKLDLPIHVHGGMGLHTIGAVLAAGAVGVVLDHQLALLRESDLPTAIKQAIARMDGGESQVLGAQIGAAYRLFPRRDRGDLDGFKRDIARLAQIGAQSGTETGDQGEAAVRWTDQLCAAVKPDAPLESAWLIGQDGAFAAPLAKKFATVYRLCQGLLQSADEHVAAARENRPLAPESPLALSHGTRYPIVQGPMTRVSDRAEFAAQVAENGALPFLALALMRAPQITALLQQTRDAVGGRPWGVGMLGFIEPELLAEQMAPVNEAKPDYALIAGGRPEQALAFEQAGIPAYLHVPSPELLRLFIANGARRFIFEGRECGGHIGPRDSFVLWEGMIEVLLETVPRHQAAEYHILFAGGIHDALSASMVEVIAGTLAAHGCRIGVLMGTAYTVTREAVDSGAVITGFQQQALDCEHTVTLESGPGHVTRCAATDFVGVFNDEKNRLVAAGEDSKHVRDVLERFNVGRLRIATKGMDRNPDYADNPKAARLVEVAPEYQHQQGLYMLGQVAALRHRIIGIGELHAEVSEGSSAITLSLPVAGAIDSDAEAANPAQVAIIGMGTLLPKANRLSDFWENILDKVDAITEVPEDRWDWRRYFDPDRNARDKIYSKWGGFVSDVPFDPLDYGIPPNSLKSIEPLHLLVLEAVKATLEDAGFENGIIPDPELRRRTSVILGAGGGTGALGQRYAVRSYLPTLMGDAPEWALDQLPEWTEDSFPGVLINVTAGRVANRFDLGGVNFTVDAACGSSLASINMAVKELQSGSSDMVIVGGADAFQNPFDYVAFSKTRALSPRGRCHTFDADADGIAISEGVSLVVLRRLTDAEREGDRIYALIQGTAGSSDGRDKSLTAPRPEGQMSAVRRAYSRAGIHAADIGMVEAHGTGTVVGDQAEVSTLTQVFGEAGVGHKTCGLGSVKSMVGHTKSAAGTTGVIKMALALHHKVQPPTLNVTRPNPEIDSPHTPFYLLADARPWIAPLDDGNRLAAVSAFGFGGTNFHAVLEEYRGAYATADREPLRRSWPSELLLWSAANLDELSAALQSLLQALHAGSEPRLKDLAYSLQQRYRADAAVRLAMVADNDGKLAQRLQNALSQLDRAADGHSQNQSQDAITRTLDPRGLYLSTAAPADGGVAFLFPGQGSQYPQMLRELALYFPAARHSFAIADRALQQQMPERLSDLIFPPSAYSDEQAAAQRQALTATNIAQPALGASAVAMLRVLESFGLKPDMVGGHSYGEYVALYRAAVIDEATLYRLSEIRGRSIVEAAGDDLGTMASVQADAATVEQHCSAVPGVQIANRNAPEQTVIAGPVDAVAQAVTQLEQAGLSVRPIPVACGFHSRCVAPARDRLADALAEAEMHRPELPVYSNSTAAPYPEQPEQILALLSDHLVSQVDFIGQVQAMHDAGARHFVEVGPNGVLSKLVGRILTDRPHLAVSADSSGRPGLAQLQQLLGQLRVAGVPLELDALYQGRDVRRIDPLKPAVDEGKPQYSPTTWLLSGGNIRPHNKPKISMRDLPPATVRERLNAPVVAAPAPAAPAAATPPAVAPIQAPGQAAAAAAASDQVMAQYLKLTKDFLESQQQVMLSYLRTRGAATGVPNVTAPATLAVPLPTAPAASQPAPPTPAPATPTPPVPTAAAVSASAPATPQVSISDTLLTLVGERTGYPPEMLDLDLNLEADLGVDSIKRTEILGAFRQQTFPDGGDAVTAAVEQAAREKTLRGIIACFADLAAATAATPGPAPAVAATPAAVSGAQVGDTLLALVGERTGYPPEMLDLDLNLEADLGVDSIKRTEILGAFRQQLFPDGGDAVTAAVEQAAREKTLRGIIGCFSNLGAESEAPSPTPATTTDDPLFNATAPRFVLTPLPAPITPPAFSCAPGSLYLITDDQQGVADALAARLQAAGARALLLQLGEDTQQLDDGHWRLDLRDPDAVRALRDQLLADKPPIGGVFHCLPLAPRPDYDQLDLDGWLEQLRVTVKSLFNLAMVFDADLQSAAQACMVAATRLGGDMGFGATGTGLPIAHGGTSGLLKTFDKEWDRVRCRNVDFDPNANADDIAARLLQEAAHDDPTVDVGYRNDERLWFPARRRILPPDPVAIDLDRNSVLVVTGGARGITAEVAHEFAQRYQPRLVLCGSSPPAQPEAAELQGIEEPMALKAALIARSQRQGGKPDLAAIETEHRRVMKNREILANIDALTRAGARVEYHQVNVKDEARFGAFIDSVYAEHGRIDGVIHGAGIIEDKLIGDKTGESFDRVVETKAIGSYVLSRRLRPDSLKFLALFTSVAGRFGNRGQCDYAAINEVMSKLALRLNRQWPARVVAVSWGPWDKTGMVSPEIKRQFTRLGIIPVSAELGRHALDMELRYGDQADAEVVWGQGPWADEYEQAAGPNRP